MSDIQVILQNSILSTAGAEGLARFNKAVSPDAVPGIVSPDGSLDLSRLMNMLLEVFHEDQASSIMDNTLARYMEVANEEQENECSSLEAVVQEIRSADATAANDQDRAQQESAMSDAASIQALKAGDQNYREQEIAEYFEADTAEVRDLINEARRIRVAMGKPAPKMNKPLSLDKTMPVPEAAKRPEPMGTIRKTPRTVPLSDEQLDQEIEDYIVSSSLTSIDAMDVMLYLKEKGYYFQENTVLEKVYLKIEEQKKKVRNWILHDIRVFLADKAWPNENDVSAYIRHVHEIGIVYDDAEIRRMILNEMIRKA